MPIACGIGSLSDLLTALQQRMGVTHALLEKKVLRGSAKHTTKPLLEFLFPQSYPSP